MVDSVERLVNMALYLAAAREPVTAERIRAEVSGYPQDQSEDAFLRMFERDKDDLRAMGFAIETEDGRLYFLDDSETFATALDLSPSEAAALRVAGSAVLDDDSFPFVDDLRRALAKTCAETHSSRPPAATRLADEDPARQGAVVTTLSTAAESCKSVSFHYTNSSGISAPHDVEPYGLFLYDGRWYLVGRDIAKDEVRTYTIARMTGAAVNSARPKTPDFVRPPEFDVAGYVRLPFQYGDAAEEFAAVVLIDGPLAWRAPSLAGGHGELVTRGDGTVIWTVAARSRGRLLRFLIENGPGLRLQSPPELIDELAEKLDLVARAHG